jgi:signal transduction histidine kinase
VRPRESARRARRAPHTVITQIGERLEGRMAPAQILPAVVSAIAAALKIPYAAISWSPGEPPVAEYGVPRRRPRVELPLQFRGETVGCLVVEARSPEEAFTATERTALADLSRQAAAAAHAVRLIEQLQQARERLVTGREEERRRLRRDLHDGVGSALAGMTMQLGAARTLLATGRPEPAADLVGAVEQQLAGCAAEVRRAIRDLRPPALDEHGLVVALRQETTRFDRELHIDIDAPDDAVARLPAAVEVAALRIAVEAVTNAARHARARRCVVTVRRSAAAIELEVTDDGCGIAAGTDSGVGMHSMRERAAELNGEWSVSPGPERGTRVRARLPVQQSAGTHDGS